MVYQGDADTLGNARLWSSNSPPESRLEADVMRGQEQETRKGERGEGEVIGMT